MTASYKIALAASGLLLLIVISSLILRSSPTDPADPLAGEPDLLASVDDPPSDTPPPYGGFDTPPQPSADPAEAADPEPATRINFSDDPLPPLGTESNDLDGPEPEPIESLTMGRKPFASDNPLFGDTPFEPSTTLVDDPTLVVEDAEAADETESADPTETEAAAPVVTELGPTDPAGPDPREAADEGEAIASAQERTPPREPPILQRYTIESGDSLSSVALTFYGSANKWVDIAQANPLVDPNRLRVGQEIKLPDLSGRNAKADTDDAGEGELPRRGATYTVKSGDSLSTIAKQFYGSSAKWELVYQANRQTIGSDPGRLKLGMELLIPPPDRGAD